jgi:hypothetical protein
MSIETFHHALHGACEAETLLTELRAITKIEDPAEMSASGADAFAGWINWDGAAA